MMFLWSFETLMEEHGVWFFYGTYIFFLAKYVFLHTTVHCYKYNDDDHWGEEIVFRIKVDKLRFDTN